MRNWWLYDVLRWFYNVNTVQLVKLPINGYCPAIVEQLLGYSVRQLSLAVSIENDHGVSFG